MSATASHVAIIMDGNARWAADRGLEPLDGHRAGAKALKRTVRHAVKHDLDELTVFAFSTENWSRPREEVDGLMAMFGELIASETPELHEEGVQMTFIGSRDGLSEELLLQMDQASTLTRGNTNLKLFVAFNYGGRAEIMRAASRFDGSTEAEFAALLDAPAMTDPELVIRTSGERRLSNYLLWQTAYSELYFEEKYWPDFDEPELLAALSDFAARQRRFGVR